MPDPVTDPALLAKLNATSKPVTDPKLLAKLDGGASPKPVTDPALLTQLEAPKKEGVFDRTKELFKGGVETIKRGYGQLTTDSPEDLPGWVKTSIGGETPGSEESNKSTYSKLAGAGNIVSGALEAALSPLGLVSQQVAKIPIPTGTGETAHIPEEVTETALGLAPVGAFAAFGKTLGLASGAQKVKSGASTISKALSAAPEAELAKSLIRQEGGTAARTTATTAAKLDPFYKKVNTMDDAARLDLLGYMEGRSKGAKLIDPETAPIADTVRNEFLQRRTTLENMPATSQAHFVDDYFPHMWEDTKGARKFSNNFGKQGSAKNLKGRTIPTISDGLAAGLKLKTTDPLEATMGYVANMDRFIASHAVIDEARRLKHIKYFSVGSRRIPEDWAPIEGRASMKQTQVGPMQAYAPKEFARVYNNFISRGFHQWERAGKIFDAAQKTSNAVTALELGLSGYHAVTMANEAGMSAMARGIQEIVGGVKKLDPKSILRGVAHMGEAYVKPVTSALRGRQVQRAYLGQVPGTAHMEKIVSLLERAGGRAVGFQHAPDYKFSASNSYWASFRRGALRTELAADLATAKGQAGFGAVKVLFKHMGRTLSTVAQPLFEKYIPQLKDGAFYDTMTSWLEMHPAATEAEQLTAARKIWDSMDNRFGEMVQDNIFWNKLGKQVAQLAMRSYSWNMGTIREIGGGAMDIAKGNIDSSRAAYVIAMPLWVGTMNAVYQYLKTGKAPESVQDLLAGQTGGTAQGASVPSTQFPPKKSTRSVVPERVSVPGYQKDVFGWYENWQQEAKNKVATAPRMAWELSQNQDWKGDPIFNPEASAPQWLKQFFQYATQNMGPISARQLLQGEKTGSKISPAEQLAGIRPAPAYLQDPEGYERAQHNRRILAQRKKAATERSAQRQYGGVE